MCVCVLRVHAHTHTQLINKCRKLSLSSYLLSNVGFDVNYSDFHCQLDRIKDHHGNTLLSVSEKVFLQR